VRARDLLEREFVIDNLLVRIHVIIVMIRWTGLAPWEYEFPFPGSRTSTMMGPACARAICASRLRVSGYEDPGVGCRVWGAGLGVYCSWRRV